MIVPSQKEASDRFDLRNIDSSKVFSRADSRILGAALQHLFEATRGVSLGTDEGSSSGINDLSVISATNYTTYQEEIMQAIQTCVANKNLLTVDPSSTANGLILTNRYIDNETTVSGINEAKTASFAYRFREGLELDFVPIANNTGAVTISIPNFQGVNGALNIVKQDGSALIQGDIQIGYRYTIICDNTNNRFVLKNRIASTFGKASASDITTGTADSLVITPLALKDVMSSSIISGTGWAKYSNGIITNQLQTPTISSGGSTTITLPAAYTSSTSYRCFATLRGGIPNQSCTPSTNRISNTQVTIGHFASGGSPVEYDIFTIGI